MTQSEKLELLEELLDVEQPLKPDSVLGDLEEWDSLSRLALVVKVKEMYGLELTTKQMEKFITVQDICNYLK